MFHYILSFLLDSSLLRIFTAGLVFSSGFFSTSPVLHLKVYSITLWFTSQKAFNFLSLKILIIPSPFSVTESSLVVYFYCFANWRCHLLRLFCLSLVSSFCFTIKRVFSIFLYISVVLSSDGNFAFYPQSILALIHLVIILQRDK